MNEIFDAAAGAAGGFGLAKKRFHGEILKAAFVPKLVIENIQLFEARKITLPGMGVQLEGEKLVAVCRVVKDDPLVKMGELFSDHWPYNSSFNQSTLTASAAKS